MIVVVVLATLMGISFRLVGIGGESSSRSVTITRLQKLENCLSGYFAAFGSYPPVALHASRDVYSATSAAGDQESGQTGALEWRSVESACKAQPVAMRYPFPSSMQSLAERVSQEYIKRCNSSDTRFKSYQTEAAKAKYAAGFGTITRANDVSGWNTKSSWQDTKIFQFGLMSFLLPRYKFMLDFVRDSSGNYDDTNAKLDNCAQWTANNTLSANPMTGEPFSSWSQQFETLSDNAIRLIPSQAVTVRWIPNLEGIVSCSGNKEFAGVYISDNTGGELMLALDSIEPVIDEIFEDQSGKRYLLDQMTVKDGWGNEFFYYSPPPYQSYRLWSAGPNGRTFPPWMSLGQLKSDSDRRTASNWMADDIMQLNN